MTDCRRGLLIVAVILATVVGAMACDGIVVGRLASVDGSVLLGHNEENALDRVLNSEIPRIGRRGCQDGPRSRRRSIRAGLAVLVERESGPGIHDGYLNEWGVAS